MTFKKISPNEWMSNTEKYTAWISRSFGYWRTSYDLVVEKKVYYSDGTYGYEDISFGSDCDFSKLNEAKKAAKNLIQNL